MSFLLCMFSTPQHCTEHVLVEVTVYVAEHVDREVGIPRQLRLDHSLAALIAEHLEAVLQWCI